MDAYTPIPIEELNEALAPHGLGVGIPLGFIAAKRYQGVVDHTSLVLSLVATIVALVIFARWNPLGCFAAALLFGGAGALGPALQSVGITEGYYFFNAAPYVLTLVLMLLSVAPGRALKGVPGELSIVR